MRDSKSIFLSARNRSALEMEVSNPPTFEYLELKMQTANAVIATKFSAWFNILINRSQGL